MERVTGIEPAWAAWKASGTRFRLSVKMAVDLPVYVFDLDRCPPCLAPVYRPYGPARRVSWHLLKGPFPSPVDPRVGPAVAAAAAAEAARAEGVARP